MNYKEIPTNCRNITNNIPQTRNTFHQFKDKSFFTRAELKKSMPEYVQSFDEALKDCLTLGILTKNSDNTYSRNLNFGKTMKKEIHVFISETDKHGDLVSPLITKTFPDTAKGHNESVKYLQDLMKRRGLTEQNTQLSIEIETK